MTDERTRRAVDSLRRAVCALERSATTPIAEPRDLSGIVKDFELAYELSWKALKKALEAAGHAPGTARDAFQVAYETRLLDDDAGWIEMIADRNRTVHTYNESFARAPAARVRDRYLPLLAELVRRLEASRP
jgi:nucleotidyltransferase substrate binding protein (TIGR01987 family)